MIENVFYKKWPLHFSLLMPLNTSYPASSSPFSSIMHCPGNVNFSRYCARLVQSSDTLSSSWCTSLSRRFSINSRLAHPDGSVILSWVMRSVVPESWCFSISYFVYTLVSVLKKALCQVHWTESQWQQLFQGINIIMFLIHCQNNLKCLRVTKFHHYLSAHTAWSRVFGQNTAFSANNANRIKFLYPLAYSLKERSSLSAVSRCVCCIFNITPCIDFSILRKQCCANFKIGIWCKKISTVQLLSRLIYQSSFCLSSA